MTGEYVLFLDSDDFLEKECVKELVQLMEKHNLDKRYLVRHDLSRGCSSSKG